MLLSQHKYREKNQKVCDTLNVKEGLFCEEELMILLKGLKNNKSPGIDSVVNESLKYRGYEVRAKLLKILNMIFRKKGNFLSILGKLLKPLYKKGDKSECDNYRGSVLFFCRKQIT